MVFLSVCLTGSERGLSASSSQFPCSSSCFNAPHMKLIRVSAHMGGGPAPSGAPAVWLGVHLWWGKEGLRLIWLAWLAGNYAGTWALRWARAHPGSVRVVAPARATKTILFLCLQSTGALQNPYSNISPSRSSQWWSFYCIVVFMPTFVLGKCVCVCVCVCVEYHITKMIKAAWKMWCHYILLNGWGVGQRLCSVLVMSLSSQVKL